MTKNPLINALSATLYICILATFMFYGVKFIPAKDTVLAPIAMISLFTMSAAVMGYLFVYQPLLLVLDGKKKQGIHLFLQTLAIFASTTFLVFVLMFLGFLQ